MRTHDELRSQVVLGGQGIDGNPTSAFQMLGYCPQHDALWKNVSIREHIECYAAIRGVSKADTPSVTDQSTSSRIDSTPKSAAANASRRLRPQNHRRSPHDTRVLRLTVSTTSLLHLDRPHLLILSIHIFILRVVFCGQSLRYTRAKTDEHDDHDNHQTRGWVIVAKSISTVPWVSETSERRAEAIFRLDPTCETHD
ncbi:ATP-binding cassette sub-family A member 8 [Eumeta japonica]|uniref:ATP-binding cassette sub-family A member 8 n=1 Tax=Eumeta variegata TaxID=151549 RepID=A0A4C1XQ29_EUMVA|nr:ATP-binding cassette sub-family A member 8 [Eumeta japonica]